MKPFTLRALALASIIGLIPGCGYQKTARTLNKTMTAPDYRERQDNITLSIQNLKRSQGKGLFMGYGMCLYRLDNNRYSRVLHITARNASEHSYAISTNNLNIKTIDKAKILNFVRNRIENYPSLTTMTAGTTALGIIGGGIGFGIGALVSAPFMFSLLPLIIVPATTLSGLVVGTGAGVITSTNAFESSLDTKDYILATLDKALLGDSPFTLAPGETGSWLVCIDKQDYAQEFAMTFNEKEQNTALTFNVDLLQRYTKER